MHVIHDPQARLDYQWDWTEWLDVGETITTFTVTVTPNDELLVDGSSENAGKITAWLKGGVLGRDYAATCHVVTSTTREDDRMISLSVQNR